MEYLLCTLPECLTFCLGSTILSHSLNLSTNNCTEYLEAKEIILGLVRFGSLVPRTWRLGSHDILPYYNYQCINIFRWHVAHHDSLYMTLRTISFSHPLSLHYSLSILLRVACIVSPLCLQRKISLHKRFKFFSFSLVYSWQLCIIRLTN